MPNTKITTITGTVDDPVVPDTRGTRIGDTVIWTPLSGETIQSIVATTGSFSQGPGPSVGDSWSATVGRYDVLLNLNYRITFTNQVSRTPKITSNAM